MAECRAEADLDDGVGGAGGGSFVACSLEVKCVDEWLALTSSQLPGDSFLWSITSVRDVGKRILLGVNLVIFVSQGGILPTGAPFSTCLTMFPKHGAVEKQLLPSPFFISLSSNTYTPGQVITVELTSTNGTLFRGLQVKATRSQGNSERAVGSFMVSHDNKTKAFTCDGSYKSMATHANAADVKRVVLKWTAPRENIGDIVFLATIVEKFDTIWYGIKSTLRTASPSNLVEQSKLPELNSSMDDVDFSSCGSEKSCFLYPRYCKSSDCLAAASFRHVDDMFLQFELMAKNVSYISIGFSEDVKMGGDETISCTADGGVLSVQHGANPKQFNDRMVRDQLSNLRIKQADGIIMCSFTRPVMAVTRTVNQSAPDLQFVEKVFDLSKEYHVMLAWGTVKLGTDVINKHVDLPVVTDRKVNFQGKDIYRGSSLPLEVRAHAGLMALAWIVLAGITTAMSRYYKDWFGERLFFIGLPLSRLSYLRRLDSSSFLFTSMDWSRYV
ncbi:hypothetical protein C0Q70_09707 [Pomacea canaliculata]|uniref:Reelin domain-containing protein n=1 Tax=Pomacea canaliculata TaxID=400727 RepID=A0A2T7PAJ8_POMCA|nr:hypothetical protein C0Q70_09707 [Pomacea canaliculata]